ncbi:SAM-dependent methyltransferase [Actinomadura fibrosa]|uniref:SAM-dependent methyltransferase n=1 Tax=Actinomadura fibrosa TaxID=111802 RepID=UPI0024155930|nr:SAM-dependent methyltransferase [Actinomadura fibrosa]
MGGKDNFQADREVAARLLEVYPPAREAIVQNRKFLIRAVEYLAREAGVRRFLDIGAGLPTRDNVHEVARRNAPGSQTVYVDNDPVVLAHARALLAGGDGVQVVEGDLREPDGILKAAAVRRLLEPGEPVALLIVALLDFITADERPHAAVAALVDALPSGSHLVITHGVTDDAHARTQRDAQAAYDNATAGFRPRTREEIGRFLDGLEVVPPGLVEVTAWRPDGEARPSPATSAAVARKP